MDRTYTPAERKGTILTPAVGESVDPRLAHLESNYLSYMTEQGKLVNITDPSSREHMFELADTLRHRYSLPPSELAAIEAKNNLRTIFNLKGEEASAAYDFISKSIGHDNHLGKSVNEFAKNLRKAYQASHVQQKLGELYFTQMLFGSNEKLTQQIESLEKQMPQNYGGTFVQEVANAIVSLFPQMEARYRKALPVAILTSGAAAVYGAATGPGAGAFAAGGFLAGMFGGSLEAGFEIMSGLKYRDLLNSAVTQDGHNMKPELMKTISLATGGLQALLEVPSQLSGLKFIPGLQGVLTSNADEVVQSAMTKFVKSAATKERIQALANVVNHANSEGIEEFSQGLVDMMADYVAMEAINKAAQEGKEVDFSFKDELKQAMYEGVLGFVVGGLSAGTGQITVNALDKYGKVLDVQSVAKKYGVDAKDVAPFSLDPAGVDSQQTISKHRYLNNARTEDFNRLSKVKVTPEIAKKITNPYLSRAVSLFDKDQSLATEAISREKARLAEVDFDKLNEVSQERFITEIRELQFISPDGSIKPSGDKIANYIYTNDDLDAVGISHNSVLLDRNEIARYLGKENTDPLVAQVYQQTLKEAKDGKFSITEMRSELETELSQIIKRNEGVLLFKNEEQYDPDVKPEYSVKYLVKTYDQFASEKLEQGYSAEQIIEMYNEKIAVENRLLAGEYALHPNFEIFMKDPKTGNLINLNKKGKINERFLELKKRVSGLATIEAAEEVGIIEKGAMDEQKSALREMLEAEDVPESVNLKPSSEEGLASEIEKARRDDRTHIMKLVREGSDRYKGKTSFYKQLNPVSAATHSAMERTIQISQKIREFQKAILREDPYYRDQKRQQKSLMASFDAIKEFYFKRARSMDALEFPVEIKTEMEKLIMREYVPKIDGPRLRAILLYIETKNLPEEKIETIRNYKKANEWYEKAINISDDEKLIADKIEARMQEMVEEAKANQVITWDVENYVPHYWKPQSRKDDPIRKPGHSNSFSPFSPHSLKRKYETSFDALMAKREFMFRDPLGDLFSYERDMQASMAAKDFINIGTRVQTLSGKPFLSRRKYDNYAQIDHPAFRVDTPQPGVPYSATEGNDAYHLRKIGEGPNDFMVYREEVLYAPVEVSKFIDNAFGESRLKDSGIVEFLTSWTSTRKAVRLLMSLYHTMSFQWQWFAGVHEGAYKKELGGINPRKAYKAGLRLMQERHKDVELLFDNGLTFDMNTDFLLTSGARRFAEKMKGPLAPLRVVILATNKYNDWLFNRFGTGLKISAGLVELNGLREKYSWMDQDKLARAVAQHVNNDFGGLDLRRMGRNQTLQHLFKLVCMAPDWNESNIRTMTSLLGKYDPLGKGKNIKIGGQNQLIKKLAQRMWLGGGVKLIALNLIGNFLMSALEVGAKDWLAVIDNLEENYKLAWESGNLNWLKIDITPIYHAMGINIKDNRRRYYNVGRHWLDFGKWIFNTPGTAWAKKSFLLGDIIALSTGQVFGAMELTTLKDLADNQGYMKWGGARDARSMWELFPSYVIYSIVNMSPAQVGHIVEYAAGKQEWLDAIMNVSGLGISYGESDW